MVGQESALTSCLKGMKEAHGTLLTTQLSSFPSCRSPRPYETVQEALSLALEHQIQVLVTFFF